LAAGSKASAFSAPRAPRDLLWLPRQAAVWFSACVRGFFLRTACSITGQSFISFVPSVLPARLLPSRRAEAAAHQAPLFRPAPARPADYRRSQRGRLLLGSYNRPRAARLPHRQSLCRSRAHPLRGTPSSLRFGITAALPERPIRTAPRQDGRKSIQTRHTAITRTKCS